MREWLKRRLPPPILRARWHKYYWDEFNGAGERELRELPALVPKDKMAVDVGGSVGTYTFHLSRFAKSVLTFEPNPELHWRYPILALPNVTLETVALSDHTGTAVLNVPTNLDSSGLGSLESHVVDKVAAVRKLEVPLRRLDSYGLEDVGFVKIDTEGHEEAVLRGATSLIERCGPTFLIEIEESHNPGGLARVVAFFAERGYHCFYFDGDVRRPFAEFDLERDQAVGSVRREDAGRYINNFIFQRQSV